MLIGILVKFITIISKILINIPVTILLDIEKGSLYTSVYWENFWECINS